jgi:long-chain acyl-CoA synthetase
MSETQGAMARQSLFEYFQPDSRPSNEIAIAWRSGYRMVRWTRADLLRAAVQFARELETRGIAKGDRVLIWGENSGEWVAAFLGCLFRGAVAVPMDAVAEKGFAQRVARQASVRLAVVERDLVPESFSVPVITFGRFSDVAEGATSISAARLAEVPIGRSDPIEIVFTSGTTAEPRGVVLTHGNLLANLEPIEKEIERYRKYERLFHPLRFLALLPLSHVFGQLLGIFLPQILGATSVFLDTLNPGEVIQVIRKERISVLATVPRLIESLRDQMERDLAESGRLDQFRSDFVAAENEHFLRRWWRFRTIHRRFGWKFWALVSGGASLSPDAEKFWGRLGYAVIQGYGLTETTSLVSLNHPFRLGRGSIGKTLPGLEVKLSSEGEILVRGENVAAGYWKDASVAPAVDSEGWFHTGDLGQQDQNGNLYFKGRKKNVIVTPEGLNIYPADLETELRKEPEVSDCVVIGLERDGNAEPCAVLLLRDSFFHGRAAEIVHRANERLAGFQQMRRWIVWPEKDFPRTPTQKPVLGRIREFAEANLGGKAVGRTASSPLGEILARISHGATPQAYASRLQLSSIERVELLSALEDRYQVDLSETEFSNAETLAGLERLLELPPARAPLYHYPRWAQSWPIRWLRAASYYLLARPAMFLLGEPRISGQENLRSLNSPVLIISNHITYLDPGYVLAALPARLRRRVAVAMEGEVLEAMRTPPRGTRLFAGVLSRVQYWLVVALFNVFPLPQRAGFRKSFNFAGDLIDRGWSVLIFPEGARTRDGKMAPFRAGIGLLATRVRLPVVPVHLDGIFERKQAGKRWALPGKIKVTVGVPINFSETEPAEQIALELERRVAALETKDT